MAYIIKRNWRSFLSISLVALIPLCTLFWSTASARTKLFAKARPDATLAGRTPIYSPGSSTFSAPFRLVRPAIPPTPGVTLLDQDIEPEIKTDVFGNIYVTAIDGVPGGVDLWKSTDKGATFTFLGHPDGAQDRCGNAPLPTCVGGVGGGDDSIDVSNGGFLYVSSLSLASVTVSTSTDGGMGGVLPGQAWTVNPATTGIPVEDRQWLAAYGPETVYMTFRQAPGTGRLLFVKSTDAGKTFSAPMLLTSADSTQGNLVVDQYNGNLYTTTIPSSATNRIDMLRSTDGGTTWTTSTPYTGPAGTNPGHKFTITTVDRGGNVYLAFSRSNADGTNCHVYLISSTNQGATWSTPVQIDTGASNTTAVMPWIVGGSAGVVNVTWLGSSGASPDIAPFDWKVFFAQVTSATSASPTIAQSQVTADPMHDATICFNGTGCATGTRDLAEYYAMTIDPDGNANISYPDSVHECTASNCVTTVWYTKQTGGSSALQPPAAPAPATFATSVPVGSPGAEPSLWVDSFNCIYVTAPGNPWVWKSVDKGASFLPPINPVADEPTVTGGDEDIITVPKQDGSHTRPDQVYFTDLGITSCHIRKSTDGAASWTKPGGNAAAGDVSVSSDRQWLAWDQGYPNPGDQIIYHWEHEFVSEAMRFSSLVNDTAWVSTTGMTNPELFAPPSNTLPNTNPGPVFTNRTLHRVFGLFNGSVPGNNVMNPPFGKLLNVWEADAAAPIAVAAPVTDVQNHHVFMGTYDSPNNPPPATGPPTGPNYGTNNANIFPAGDIDSNGNIYVAWSMNNSRTNEFSIWFAASHDNGQTFYGPFPVSSGPMAADETAVFPWVAAGDNGRVDIIWYGTTAVGDPNTLTGSPAWTLHFAQTLNGNSREPVFTAVQPNPSNVIHNGQISTGGTFGSSDRSLLDFMEVNIGPDGLANIVFADNAGQPTRAEFTRQTSGPLAKTNPTSPTCLPAPPPIVAAVSRKTHTGVGDFDVDLLPPAAGIECRSGGANGDYKLVVTFPHPIGINTVTVTSGTGSVSGFSASGSVITVNLTGVTNAQHITVSLNGVTDANGSGNVPITMGVLLGDTNADGSVNSADISQTKSQSGQAVSSSNFREDVNTDGALNSADISVVKSKSGTALP